MAETLGRYSAERQRLILDQSIHAVMHHEGSGSGAADGIHRVVQVHSRHGEVPIEPTLYPVWVESLVESLRETDPDWDATLEKEWRAVIAPVVDTLVELHLAGPPGYSRGGGIADV
ncbi:hypothetical protein [Thioalkalivibrio sp. AKL19]|uniref:hypothetical protein n=1 Tax=Thioalkalivibrio sp. AKL19 TaxID=1266914 RepID=UPI0003FB6429|nr:hypothetical protein [Thioalkalivibrio sp. AKL19]